MPCPAPHQEALHTPRVQALGSSLLTQTRSRIGKKCGMRKRLGEKHWDDFVKYAMAEHKAAFLRSLIPTSGVLRCAGKIDGTPCPNNVCINLSTATEQECASLLPSLHMDHTHDLKRICKVWSDALPEHPSSWNDGICGPLLAHLLFGTEDHLLTQCSSRSIWRRQIVFRCGNVNGVAGQNADDFCHDVANPHSQWILMLRRLHTCFNWGWFSLSTQMSFKFARAPLARAPESEVRPSSPIWLLSSQSATS